MQQEEDYLQTVCEWRHAVTVTAKVTYLHQLAETIVTTDSEEAGPRAFSKGSNALLSFEEKNNTILSTRDKARRIETFFESAVSTANLALFA